MYGDFSDTLYIPLIARTQTVVRHEHGIIIQAPDGEVFCSRTMGLSCGRGGGLTYAPDLFPELYLWSGMMAEIFGQQWQTETLTEDRETNRKPHQCQVEKEMTKSTMEYSCKSSFKCGWMGWSLHVASWLLASNGHWTENNGIMGAKKIEKKSLDMEWHYKDELFLSCLYCELYH